MNLNYKVVCDLIEENSRVLDLGCGCGGNCVEFIKSGASSVVGVDISEKMLSVAKEKL